MYILAIFINLFQHFFKWTFKLSTYLNLLLFSRDGLFNYLAILVNVIAFYFLTIRLYLSCIITLVLVT